MAVAVKSHETAAAKSEAASEKAQGLRLTLAALVSAVLATALATTGTIAWANGRIDAGVAPIQKDLESHKVAESQAIQKLEVKLDELRLDAKVEAERQSRRWEAILWKLRVKDPAPTPRPKKLLPTSIPVLPPLLPEWRDGG